MLAAELLMCLAGHPMLRPIAVLAVVTRAVVVVETAPPDALAFAARLGIQMLQVRDAGAAATAGATSLAPAATAFLEVLLVLLSVPKGRPDIQRALAPVTAAVERCLRTGWSAVVHRMVVDDLCHRAYALVHPTNM
jgi:hypothetical protein